MPEREFFKFGEEVEDLGGPNGITWTYVGPIGSDGEHILFNTDDKKAYRTRQIGDFRRRRPRKGELWSREDALAGVSVQRVLIAHADEHFVVFTTNWERKMGIPTAVGNLFTAVETPRFVETRKVYEANYE